MGRIRLGHLLVMVLLALLGVMGWTTTRSLRQLDSEALTEPPAEPGIVTAVVERRMLREEVVLRARVRDASTQIYPPRALSGTITRVGVSAGEPILRGDAILSVDGRPVFAVVAEFAFYRVARFGDRGDDVEQL